MTRHLLSSVMMLGACSTQQLGSTEGQLFCSIAVGSAVIVAPIIQASATQAGGVAGGVVAVIATNAAAATLQEKCKQAAAAVGGAAGIPVAPPANAASLAPVAIPAK